MPLKPNFIERIDVSSPDLPIVTATHGEGTWEPLMIADSLQDFKMILVILNDVSSNRSNPVDIEKNPLNKKDRRTALSKIKTQNRHTDISYWENFFKNA
jgi:hypothetical protein